MKPTIKSINAALPRLDTIRRKYMFHGETGFAHGVGHLPAAYADIGEDGNVTGIAIYAVGDAQEERHYYNRTGTVSIYDIIDEVLRDWDISRSTVAHMIQDAIAND